MRQVFVKGWKEVVKNDNLDWGLTKFVKEGVGCMGACMDTATTREGTQNVLVGQCVLVVCMVFQLLCMIFDLGSH